MTTETTKDATAKPAKTKAAKAPKPAAAPKAEKPAKPLSKRAEIEASAAAGILPTAPNFAAETHKRFRKKLAEVEALVAAADLKALRAYQISVVSSSPRAIAKYRDLAVIALEAQKKQAKAAAKAESVEPAGVDIPAFLKA